MTRLAARVRAFALGRALTRALGRAHAVLRAVGRACVYDQVLDPALTRALDRARALIEVLDDACAYKGSYSLASARALDRALIDALVRAHQLAGPGHRDRDICLTRIVARDIEAACDMAFQMMLTMESDVQASPSAVATPSSVAARLARSAVRVLPTGGRRRYRAEFDSELYELATAGASRWAQLIYGLRLLDRAWVLRAELREAAARGKAVRS